MEKVMFFIAKIKAKIKKAREFYRMYKLWCIELDTVAERKLKESIK